MMRASLSCPSAGLRGELRCRFEQFGPPGMRPAEMAGVPHRDGMPGVWAVGTRHLKLFSDGVLRLAARHWPLADGGKPADHRKG
jgi:hypothetical protein